jgi:hypothetical protein
MAGNRRWWRLPGSRASHGPGARTDWSRRRRACLFRAALHGVATGVRAPASRQTAQSRSARTATHLAQTRSWRQSGGEVEQCHARHSRPAPHVRTGQIVAASDCAYTVALSNQRTSPTCPLSPARARCRRQLAVAHDVHADVELRPCLSRPAGAGLHRPACVAHDKAALGRSELALKLAARRSRTSGKGRLASRSSLSTSMSNQPA